MAKAKKAKKSSKPRGYARSKYSNPARRHSHKSRSRKRSYSNPGHRRRIHRNPGLSVGSIGDYTMNAVFVLIGGLGSKLGTQAVLGANNVGLIGYAANAAVGGVLWFITRMVMKGNRSAQAGIISGTILQILLRVINDYTPFGSYVANLGMGDYQMQSFVTPQILVDPWNSAQISIPPGWAPALPAPAAAAPHGGTMPNMGTNAPAPVTGTSGLYGSGGGWGPSLYA